MENENKTVSKKGNKKLLIIGAILVVLVVAGYFAYSYINSPKNLFLKSVNNGYKQIENAYNDLLSNEQAKLLEKKALEATIDVDFKVEMDKSLIDSETKKVIDEINKLKLSSKVGFDKPNKNMVISLAAKYDSSDLVAGDLYIVKSNAYLKLKDLFDKYIELPIEDTDSFFESSNTEDVSDIVKKAKDSFLKNLKEKEFKKSKETIKVNGKDVKTTKITYGFSQKTATELGKDMLIDFKNDSKFLDKVASLSSTSKEELKEGLETAIKEIEEALKEEKDDEKILEIATYVKGIKGDFVGMSITVNDEVSFTYYENGSDTEIKVTEDKQEYANILITGNEKEKKIEGDIAGVKLTANIKQDKTTSTSTFELSYSGATVKGTLESEMKEEEKDKKYETASSLTMSLEAAGTKMASVEINLKEKDEFKDKLEVEEIKDTVKYTELTEEDMNGIMLKLLQNKNLMSFITSLGGTGL